MKRYYCTYFDRNYLVKGLALIESLQTHENADFEIFVVCLDEITRAILTKLDVTQVTLLALHDIEAGDAELISKKYSRTPVEYYWTLTPTINKWILEHHPEIDVLTYLDADLYFFSSPQTIFDELGNESVLIHEHRYSETLQHLEPMSGRFNVGLLCFRNDTQALNVLNTWRNQCLDWCFFRFEDNRMGDQMYLNDWPENFDSIVILKNIGAGVAPWNHANYEYSVHEGQVRVSNVPLVFYHFHAFGVASNDVVVPAVHAHYPVSAEVLTYIVSPYVNNIFEIKELLQLVYSEFDFGLNDSVEIGADHALLIRSGSNEIANIETSLYSVLNIEDWEILIPQHRLAKSTNVNPVPEVIDIQPAVGLSAEIHMREPQEGFKAITQLQEAESLEEFMARPYYSNPVNSIYFIGVHLFEERDWFFSVYKNLESIALFEPIPHINKQLKNMFYHDSRVTVLPYAVSDSVGVAKFNVSNNLYSSSLLPMKEHSNIFPDVNMDDSIEVEQLSLQHIVESGMLAIPDMLYIDVQGAEYMVLTGMDKSLLRNVKIIYTEASTVEMYEGARLLQDIIAYLEDEFVFIGFEDMMNTGVHGDALFINKTFINSLNEQYGQAKKLADDAEIALSKSELQTASEAITAAINAWPYSSQFFSISAMIARHKGDLNEAAKCLHSGLSVDSQNPELLDHLSDVEKQIDLSAKQKNSSHSLQQAELATDITKKYQGIQISALVSTYASEEFMRECLDDLLAQTLAEHIEIIVIDANSPEDEKSIVAEYQQRFPNIKYTRTADRIGIYEAWNLAIKQAQGRYLISCSTNDRLHPKACEYLIKVLEENPVVGIAYGNAYLTREPHESFEKNSVYDSYIWPEYDYHMLLSRPLVGPHPMWRKSLHNELGYFDESYKAIGDQDFWLRVAEKYPLKRTTRFTTLHWITDESLSGNMSISQKELKRVHETYENRELYRRWNKGHSIEEIDAHLMAERMGCLWQHRPVVTLAMYLSEGQLAAFHETLASLENSFYSDWVLKVITTIARPQNLNCKKGSVEWCQVITDEQFDQAQFSLTEGRAHDWLAFILPGTVVEAHFLNSIIDYAHIKPEYQFIYCDHDQIDTDGGYQQPQFKPDFNYDYLLSYDYLGPLCLIRQSALKTIGGISFYYQLEHYDIALSIIEKIGEQAIGHIDNLLYHAPIEYNSAANHDARKEIVEMYLQRNAIAANIIDGYIENTLRIDYQHTETPLVSIIIPTRDKYDLLSACVDSLLDRTSYTNYEVIIVDNESEDIDTLEYLDALTQIKGKSIRVIRYPHVFNFAAISNLAANEAQGDYLLFLNNDTKIVQENWLDRMMSHAQRQDVGIVGPRLAYPETSNIQHAGVVLGLDSIAGHPYLKTAKISDSGYMNRLQVEQNFSAVTGACLLIRKSVYEEVNGMDETNFKVSYNDIDLCLKVKDCGHRVVWTPYATCLHHGNVSQIDRMETNAIEHQKGYLQEIESFVEKWLPVIAHDPAFNRHLSLVDGRYRVETGVIINWDKNFSDRQKILGLPLYGGSGEYRMRSPLRQIAKAGLAQTECTYPYKVNQQRIVNLAELARSGADTVISHAAIANNAIKSLKDYRKYLDVYSVFTLDDLITHVPDGNNFKRNVPPEPKKRLREALSYCDRLIVTTEPLADFCENMIDQIDVIPNCLEDELWLPLSSSRGVSKKPRVGWAGAQQHADDLAFIIDVVKETADEIDWVFFGMCPVEIKDCIAEEHQFLLNFTDYAKKLASLNLDLAIAPLAIHPFNEAKSNLRLLEYGVFGWPVICTDIYPYQTAPVTRVQNKKQAWLAAIRERINDLDAAYKEGDALRQWVLDNYLLSNQLDRWTNALNIQPLNLTTQQARRVSV